MCPVEFPLSLTDSTRAEATPEATPLGACPVEFPLRLDAIRHAAKATHWANVPCGRFDP